MNRRKRKRKIFVWAPFPALKNNLPMKEMTVEMLERIGGINQGGRNVKVLLANLRQ